MLQHISDTDNAPEGSCLYASLSWGLLLLSVAVLTLCCLYASLSWGLAPCGRCLPEALPGLLDVDTSGVRNKNILQPWEMDFQYNPWFSSNVGSAGDDNVNEFNQP